MKKLLISTILSLAVSLSTFALSVTGSISAVDCGMNTITVTFLDSATMGTCSFNGTAIVSGPSSGVTIVDPVGPGFFATVSGGQTTITLDITGAAPANFTIDFLILPGTGAPACASTSQSVSLNLSSNCILPFNNECVDAAPLTISTNTCSYSAFTTVNATDSGIKPSCGTSGYTDLWYSFTANNTTVNLDVGELGGNFGFYGLYTSCPTMNDQDIACGMMVPISPSNVNPIPLTGLTVNNTYILQMTYIPFNPPVDQELCLWSTTVVTNPCQPIVNVTSAGPYFPNDSHEASNIIQTTGTNLVSANNVIYDAKNEVQLNSGFETNNINFTATAGIGCN